jgi:DNA repair exonuclease SbcCD ATPase subunit
MKITRLDIKGFGRFQQQAFEPGPFLNLVHGPNEAGKSTLLSFVRAMLYGMRGGRRSREGELPPMRRHEPWQGGAYAGVLEYRLDDGSPYRVARNFSKGTTVIQDGHANDVTDRFPSDRETGPMFAEAHLGVDAETFVRTLQTGQMQAVLDVNGRRSLMDRLLRLQDAGREERSFRQAEEALQKALLERVGSDRSTVRPMDRILSRLEVLEAEAERIRKQREEVRETACSLLETRSLLNAMQEKQDGLLSERAALRACVRSGMLLERQKGRRDCANRLLELDAVEAAAELEARSLSARLSDRKALSAVDDVQAAQLPFDAGRLSELQRACIRLEQAVEGQMAEAARLNSEMPGLAAWHDPDRLDGLFRKYLDLREQSGPDSKTDHAGSRTDLGRSGFDEPDQVESGDEPDRVHDKLSRIRQRRIWICFSAAGAILLFMAGWLAWNGRTGIGAAAGLAALASFLVPWIRWMRKRAASLREGPHPSLPVHDGGIRQKEAQAALEALFAEAGVSTVGEFLDRKTVADTIGKKLTDLERDKAETARQILQAKSEAGLLADRTGKLLRAAGLPDDGANVEERVQAFRHAWQEYRDDRNRAAEIGMRLESAAQERTAVLRALSLLGDDGEEEGEGEGERTDVPGPMEAMELDAESAALALPELQERMERMAADISGMKQSVSAMEARLERIPEEGRLQEVMEEADRLEMKQAALKAYGESLNVALQVLREAALELRRGVSPRLDRLSGEILSRLTGGRYDRIGTDDRLSVRVEVPENPEMPEIGQLSGGTAEQAWLSVRLAAVRLLEEGRETLPIFLDEPFAQFDDERTASSLAWLKQNAGDRQIFLFTCRNRDKELAEAVFGESVTRIALSRLPREGSA